MPKVPFPEIVVNGRGEMKPPPITEDTLQRIRERAEFIGDHQLKTDVFLLLSAVDKKLVIPTR